VTRVAFLCCHLSGTGHLVRTLALARAAAAAGAEALVISGGRPLAHVDAAGVEMVQLAPVMVRDFDFSTLLTPEGRPADAAWMAERRAVLEDAIARFRADVLVTETYPLGRRTLAEEFDAAIAAARAARPSAAVVASVRDVPEPPGRPERVEGAADRLRRDYSALLVHGDPDFLALSTAWPLPEDVAPLVRQMGYVASAAPAMARQSDTVLVAGGGGPLGDRLMALAAEAAGGSARPWHLLTGSEALARELAGRHRGANLAIEPARPDYRRLLAGAAVSVSLAGYNTFTDLAACDTPAILVPFDEHGEREQVIRAGRLEGRPGFAVLRIGDLTPARLAGAVERAAAGTRRPPLGIDLDGARRAAQAILELAPR
jgi:predicted glycosyltransferase